MGQVIVGAMILLAGSISSFAAVSVTDTQHAWLQRKGKLVFASDTEYPPYTFVSADGEARGLDVDVARAVGRALGVPVELRMVPWVEAVKLVEAGEADGLAGMTHSEDRLAQWAFVEPHADVQYFLFVREDTQLVHDLKDLEGMRVGVGKGSLIEPVLRANPKITVVNYNRGQGVEELLNREITAFAGNQVVQSHFIQSRNIRGVKVVGSALMPPHSYGMAVPKGQDELRGILSAAVRELRTQGELAALQRKWVGELLRPALISRQALRWLWIGLGILAGLAGLGFLRSWELRRLVQRKTARISALRALGRSFGEVRGVDAVLDRAMDVLGPLVAPESLFVMVESERRQFLRHVRVPEALVQDLKAQSQASLRDDGLLTRVRREGQPVVVDRLKQGTSLVAAPLFELGFRSLVCMPIVAEGTTLGVMGVLSRRPARFVPKDTDFQQAVAAELGIAVANAMLFATLERRVEERTQQLNERNQQLEADLEMAREVQLALLPLSNAAGYEIARRDGGEPLTLQLHNRYSAARTVGGDFFNVMRLSPSTAGVFICDVMGQGARAALLTAIVRTLLDGLANEAQDAQQFLTGLNRRLMEVLKLQGTPIFATAFYAYFDLAAGKVTYANAGHPWPLLIDSGQRKVESLDKLKQHGPALGLFGDAVFPQTTHDFRAGQAWLLYTDGLYETSNETGESFGMERVHGIVAQRLAQPLAGTLDVLMDDLTRFCGSHEIDDDVCLLGIEAARTKAAQP